MRIEPANDESTAHASSKGEPRTLAMSESTLNDDDELPDYGTWAEVERLRAASVLSGGLAHELANPLMVVVTSLSEVKKLCRRLRQVGLEVLTAASGEEAVALSKSESAPIHLLVTDGIMPGMDGFELARVFSQRTPPVRTILISGFMGHFVSRADIPENVEAFFPKPFSGEELVAKILDILGATA